MSTDQPSSLSWKTHTGEPLPPDALFDELPLTQLGEIRSASTTRRPGEPPKFVKKTMLQATTWALPLVLGLLAMGGATLANGLGKSAEGLWGLVGIGGGLFALLGLTRLRRHECSYVGAEGAARFPVGKDGDLFLFSEARALYSGSTRHYMNLIYTGTDAHFHWVNGDGKKVYNLTLHYHSFKEKPAPDEPVHFGRAAERAWSDWVLPKHRAELERTGKTGFPLRTGGGIFLSPDGLTIRRNKQDTEISRESFQGFSVNGGYLYIHYGKKANLSFPCADVGNQMALIALALQTLKPETEEKTPDE